MSLADWWWEITHEPLQARQTEVTERGLIKPGNPPISTVTLCEMAGRDHARAEELRANNREWLAPWEATVPVGYPTPVPTFDEYTRRTRHLVRVGKVMPLAIFVDSRQVGQVTISDITRGACHSATIGYWVIPEVAGRGLMTLAVAMAFDLAFTDLGLHRVELNIRPENARSLAIPRHLGLRQEGVRRRYINIASAWADHVSFAATAEEVPLGGYVRQLEKTRGA